MAATRILFVCMGNICRSPVAEGLFRHQLEAAGLTEQYQCDSAGTHSYHVGKPPDSRSIAIARQAGLDISRQRARAIQAEDLQAFDWLICMDRDNLEHIEREFEIGEAQSRRLFAGEDVADPYYGGEQGFADMLEHLEQGIGALIDDLQSLS